MNESPHLAARMADIRPFYVMDLLARARQLEATGRSIVHLEIGEPDFATPDSIIQAGIRALQAQRTHYTPAVGLLELREAMPVIMPDASVSSCRRDGSSLRRVPPVRCSWRWACWSIPASRC
jgi:hypothetical protein